MNVYWLLARGTYGQGTAIVVADSPEDARTTALRDIAPDPWNCRWESATARQLPLHTTATLAQVIDYHVTGAE